MDQSNQIHVDCAPKIDIVQAKPTKESGAAKKTMGLSN